MYRQVCVFGIFGHKWEEMTEARQIYIMWSCVKNLKFHGIMEFHDVLAAMIPPLPQMPSWCVLLQMWL